MTNPMRTSASTLKSMMIRGAMMCAGVSRFVRVQAMRAPSERPPRAQRRGP